MERFFNIAGPCNPAKHYTLPAMARLPGVVRLIEDETCFVVHAQRQCGKTTAFIALTNEINAGSDRVAVYCSLEAVQSFPKAEDGMSKICALIKESITGMPGFGDLTESAWPIKLKYNYEKNHEKAYDQVCRYMDHLGVAEGWLVVFDPKFGDWDAKIRHEDVSRGDKTIHVFWC